MKALGMVEVVGLPPAIEAADAALKAADVRLLSIAKADAGILTVELVGDVDAVSSAVDAGAKAAERIGILRTKHVIPRADEMLIGTVVSFETQLFRSKKFATSKESPPEPEPSPESALPITEPRVIPDPEIVPEVIPEIPIISPTTEPQEKPKPQEKPEREVEPISASIPIYRASELKKKSNAHLRQLLEEYGVQMSSLSENMKKQDLISLILKQQNEKIKE